MHTESCLSAGISRRALVAAGAGWVLGAGGLLLPASMNEAEARKGADGGKLGGRHGQDHRGRNKQRIGKNGGPQDSRQQGDANYKGVAVQCENASSSSFEVKSDQSEPVVVDVGQGTAYRERNFSSIYLTFTIERGLVQFDVHNRTADPGATDPEVFMVDLWDYDFTATTVRLAERNSFDFTSASGQLFRVLRLNDEQLPDDDYFTSFKVTLL